MFSYDGSKRPTVEELKNHPWMQMKLDVKGCRDNLIEELHSKRSEKTADSSTRNSDNAMRGEPLLELVREKPENLENFMFNDMTDYEIDFFPGIVYEALGDFNENYYEKKLNIELNKDKKFIMIHQEETEENMALKVKVKFFDVTEQPEDAEEEPIPRYRVKMVKKQGDIAHWYEILKSMKETVFLKQVEDQEEMILLAPRSH